MDSANGQGKISVSRARQLLTVVAVLIVFVGALSWYDITRENGRLFVCDIATSVGVAGFYSGCQANSAASVSKTQAASKSPDSKQHKEPSSQNANQPLKVKQDDQATHWLVDILTNPLAALAAFFVLLAGALKKYDTIRNKGRMLVCDIVSICPFDLSMCQTESTDDDDDLLTQIERLKGKTGALTDSEQDYLENLEQVLAQRAVEKLRARAESIGIFVSEKVETETLEAAQETAEQGDQEERRALAMIAEGELDTGLQLLSKQASAAAQENANQWRRIGRLSYSVNTTRALEAWQKVVVLDQSDPWDAIYLGRLYVRAGNLAVALQTFEDAISFVPVDKDRDRSVLFTDTGDIQQAQGDLAGALASYRAGMVIDERLATSDPGNTGWQSDLSVSHDRVGNVQRAQGDLAGALVSYQACMDIREHLAKTDAGNTEWIPFPLFPVWSMILCNSEL